MAHPELDALLSALLPVAQMMLSKYGEFYPFGAIMSSSGEIRHVGAKVEDDDHPPSQPLIDLLTETFKKQAAKGELRAARICYDILTVLPGEDQKRDSVCQQRDKVRRRSLSFAGSSHFRQHTAYEAICSTVCSADGHSIGVASNQQEPVAPIHTARIAGSAFGDYSHAGGADPIGSSNATHDGIQSRRPSTGRR